MSDVDASASVPKPALARRDHLLQQDLSEIECAFVYRDYAPLEFEEVVFAILGNNRLHGMRTLGGPDTVQQFIKTSWATRDTARPRMVLDRLRAERLTEATKLGIPEEQASWCALLSHKQIIQQGGSLKGTADPKQRARWLTWYAQLTARIDEYKLKWNRPPTERTLAQLAGLKFPTLRYRLDTLRDKAALDVRQLLRESRAD